MCVRMCAMYNFILRLFQSCINFLLSHCLRRADVHSDVKPLYRISNEAEKAANGNQPQHQHHRCTYWMRQYRSPRSSSYFRKNHLTFQRIPINLIHSKPLYSWHACVCYSAQTAPYIPTRATGQRRIRLCTNLYMCVYDDGIMPKPIATIT